MSPYFPQRPPTWAESAAALSGDAFPTGSVDNGRIFYRTDLREWFQYVSAISRWLGQEQKLLFGNNGVAINNIYMRHIASIITTGTDFGYEIPYDITITGFTAKWTTGVTSGTWRVRREGSNIAAIPHPGGTIARIVDMTLGDDFDADGIMQVYMDTFNTTINRPTCMVFFRRRET